MYRLATAQLKGGRPKKVATRRGQVTPSSTVALLDQHIATLCRHIPKFKSTKIEFLGTAAFLPPSPPLTFNDVTCPICMAILDVPLALACGHVVCQDCLTKSIYFKPSDPCCPCCNVAIGSVSDIKKPENFLLAVLGALKVRCFWPQCTEIIPLKQLREHHDEALACHLLPLPSSSSSNAPEQPTLPLTSSLSFSPLDSQQPPSPSSPPSLPVTSQQFYSLPSSPSSLPAQQSHLLTASPYSTHDQHPHVPLSSSSPPSSQQSSSLIPTTPSAVSLRSVLSAPADKTPNAMEVQAATHLVRRMIQSSSECADGKRLRFPTGGQVYKQMDMRYQARYACSVIRTSSVNTLQLGCSLSIPTHPL